MSALDDLQFNLEDGTYDELANSLEYWAEQFYLEELEDSYGDCIAYLIYNMSKEMRKVEKKNEIFKEKAKKVKPINETSI